jgi:hypothetical protein
VISLKNILMISDLKKIINNRSEIF